MGRTPVGELFYPGGKNNVDVTNISFSDTDPYNMKIDCLFSWKDGQSNTQNLSTTLSKRLPPTCPIANDESIKGSLDPKNVNVVGLFLDSKNFGGLQTIEPHCSNCEKHYPGKFHACTRTSVMDAAATLRENIDEIKKDINGCSGSHGLQKGLDIFAAYLPSPGK